MRKTRIFVDQILREGTDLVLAEEAAHHIARVLRLRPGNPLILFNGRGGEYHAEISNISKRVVEVDIKQFQELERESSINVTLAQGISKGQKMDSTLQKAVELGVNRIVPVMSEFGNVRLDEKRLQKKVEHWRKIIIGACEQSGRNKIPELLVPVTLDAWLNTDSDMTKIMLHPESEISLSTLSKPKSEITLLVGPEGGFSDLEINQARQAAYQIVSIGPRILRTETAALVAISACQTLWGDLL